MTDHDCAMTDCDQCHEKRVPEPTIGPGEPSDERESPDTAQSEGDQDPRWFSLLLQGMDPLPASIPKIEVNSAKVAYAQETLDMIQAEAFIAECAYRRSLASSESESSLPLEANMKRRREIFQRAQAAFQTFCLNHTPHHPNPRYPS